MSVYEYIEIALQKCDHTICAILKSEVFSFTLTEQKYWYEKGIAGLQMFLFYLKRSCHSFLSQAKNL